MKKGACGGELACSTCHLIFEKDVYDTLPPKTDEEEDMLDLAFGLTETSRLGCQIKVCNEFDGIKVRIPDDDMSLSPSSSRLPPPSSSASTSKTSSTDWSAPDLQGTSLVSDTLQMMETDTEFKDLTAKIARLGKDGMTKEERSRRRRALDEIGIPDFLNFVTSTDYDDNGATARVVRNGKLMRSEPNILQLNIGLYCNQACNHCHVESSPLRKSETMDANVASRCLQLLRDSPLTVDTLDLTGGAPELNAQFRLLVSMARQWSIETGRPLTIIDRCNLTVLLEPGQEDLVTFLKDNRVTVVASLPCYGESNVDAQRGRGVFRRSIAGLKMLNDAGYGDNPELKLDLVYNPSGPFLPPSQSGLEVDYKRELMENFGIRFNNLLTITNMPIKRFADFLAKEGKMKEYMELLVNNYNPMTVDGLMCLNTVSVGWDGTLYDCDFNQQLGMGIVGEGGNEVGGKEKGKRKKLSVFDVDSLTDLAKISVRVDNHCFGCTAGSG
jgi:radical SAM/Cys-rich protein